MAKTPLPDLLREMARRRLECLPPVDLRTPEEQTRDGEALLQKVKRMRPDIYERVSQAVAGSDGDWFKVLERHLGKEITLAVAEIYMTQGP